GVRESEPTGHDKKHPPALLRRTPSAFAHLDEAHATRRRRTTLNSAMRRRERSPLAIQTPTIDLIPPGRFVIAATRGGAGAGDVKFGNCIVVRRVVVACHGALGSGRHFVCV